MAGNYIPASNPAGTQLQTSTGYYWISRPSEVFGELANQYGEHIHYAILGAANALEPEAERWMKDNAAWQDRTGKARAGLYAGVTDEPMDHVTMILGHTVHYGLFLEINYSGRYAIINPAVDTFAQRLWREVTRILA